VIGAITAGRRKGDGLVRLGFAGAVVFAVFRLLDSTLSADRVQRGAEHAELVATIRDASGAIRDLKRAVDDEQDILGQLRAVVVDRACAPSTKGAGR
jgi:hypothetical protein